MATLPQPDDLLAAASAQAGLDDFGDPRFLEGLNQYLKAVEADARLSDMGVMAVTAETTGLLVNRLRMEDAIKAHPEILDEPITKPLVIIGVPRTGTTKLQQSLGRDPRSRSLPFWQAINPAPQPGPSPDGRDPRIAIAEATVGAMAEMAPDMLAAHPCQAEEPEEEAFPMRMSFECEANGLFDYVPSLQHWLAGRSHDYSYAYLKRILQYVQWQDGAAGRRPWVLKCTLHMAHLDSLLTTFPDVTVVQCHRDPYEVVPSSLRLMEVIWQARGNQVTLDEVSAYLGYFSNLVAINLRQRDELAGRLSVLDVHYLDILKDTMSVAEQIYELWGYPLTDEGRAALVGWEDENPQNRFGKHTYSLERYGLDKAQIDSAYGAYIKRFGHFWS